MTVTQALLDWFSAGITQTSLCPPMESPLPHPSSCSLGNGLTWRCCPGICDVQLLLLSDWKGLFLGREQSARPRDMCTAQLLFKQPQRFPSTGPAWRCGMSRILPWLLI